MTSAQWTERTGLCSVTFRQLGASDVVDRAAAAGLHRIEWGSDVHAPANAPATLNAVREATHSADLSVSSYGSYWRAGEGDSTHAVRSRSRRPGAIRSDQSRPRCGQQSDDGTAAAPSIEELVTAAARLGAPRIRVWAGSVGSAESTAEQRSRVVADLRHAAEVGADSGIQIGLEFHRLTLTDTVASTRQLLEQVGHDNLATYWQPRLDEPAAEAIAGLGELVDRVCAVHVFSWWPFADRLPLADRAELWQGAMALLHGRSEPIDLLLEFVPDDDPSALPREVATLQSWIADPPAAATLRTPRDR